MNRLLACCALLPVLAVIACTKGEDPAGPPDDYIILDSALVIDQYPFKRAHCDEVGVTGEPRLDSLPAGSVARVHVISTVCYAVTIQVKDTLGNLLRTLERRFDIPGRADGDKERGMVGYLAWDGLKGDGSPAGPGAYKWFMDFRFGGGRTLAVVADIRTD
jgi:hypothetical protein